VTLDDPQTTSLLAELVALTQESAPEALRKAIQERLQRLQREVERDLVRDRSDELFGY
jgi:hypothetical protein